MQKISVNEYLQMGYEDKLQLSIDDPVAFEELSKRAKTIINEPGMEQINEKIGAETVEVDKEAPIEEFEPITTQEEFEKRLNSLGYRKNDLTLEEFKSMSYSERLELKKKDPETFEKLSKKATSKGDGRQPTNGGAFDR